MCPLSSMLLAFIYHAQRSWDLPGFDCARRGLTEHSLTYHPHQMPATSPEGFSPGCSLKAHAGNDVIRCAAETSLAMEMPSISRNSWGPLGPSRPATWVPQTQASDFISSASLTTYRLIRVMPLKGNGKTQQNSKCGIKISDKIT